MGVWTHPKHKAHVFKGAYKRKARSKEKIFTLTCVTNKKIKPIDFNWHQQATKLGWVYIE